MNAQKALVFMVRRLKFECHINMQDDASNPEDTREIAFMSFANSFVNRENFQDTTAYIILLKIYYHSIILNFNNVYNFVKQSKSLKIVLFLLQIINY